MSTATEASYKSEKRSSQKDSKSRKKMNVLIAIRCNSFKVVGALLICTGVMNFYLSSIWVSAVIVFAGCLTIAWIILIKSRMNWKHPYDWIRWVVDLSLLPFLSVLRIINIIGSTLRLPTDESRRWWNPLDCATSATRREHCKRWPISLRVDTGSCHTTVAERTNDDRCCRLGFFWPSHIGFRLILEYHQQPRTKRAFRNFNSSRVQDSRIPWTPARFSCLP